jgi:hypothetical protein
MIPNGFFTQVGMVIVSVAIVFTVVEPTIAEIGEIQDDISVYQTERDKVISVNSRLSSLLSVLESVPVADNRRLLTYLPNSVDEISVLRDLYIMVNESGAQYINVANESSVATNQRGSRVQQVQIGENDPIPHTFVLAIEGTYVQIKRLLALLEQNHYLLEVKGLTIQSNEGGFLKADITLVTYSYQIRVN